MWRWNVSLHHLLSQNTVLLFPDSHISYPLAACGDWMSVFIISCLKTLCYCFLIVTSATLWLHVAIECQSSSSLVSKHCATVSWLSHQLPFGCMWRLNVSLHHLLSQNTVLLFPDSHISYPLAACGDWMSVFIISCLKTLCYCFLIVTSASLWLRVAMECQSSSSLVSKHCATVSW